MTTPVETKTTETISKATTTKAKRKPLVKREFNELGKFFAKIRIDAGLTTLEWAKALGVSQLAVTNVERGDSKMTFEYALKVHNLIEEKTPHYVDAFASVVANELQVLMIPANVSINAVENAYNVLTTFDKVEQIQG